MTVFGTQRHDHFIQSRHDSELTLRLRQVTPLTDGASATAVLCIHGAVLHSVLFDLPVPGLSWLEHFAARGVDAFALDLRGYGHSSKAKVMEQAEKRGTLACTHEEALQDILDAVMFIREHLKVEKVVLVGLSWGSVLAGSFTQKHPDLVEKLVFLGPVYSFKNPAWGVFMDPENPKQLSPSIGLLRIVTKDMLFFGWNQEIPEEHKTTWRGEDVELAILEDVMQTDQEWSATREQPSIRVPSGVWLDVAKIYNEEPLYDAANIACPILIMRGQHDKACLAQDMQPFFEALGSQDKYYLQIGNATHYALAERASAPFMMQEALEFMRR